MSKQRESWYTGVRSGGGEEGRGEERRGEKHACFWMRGQHHAQGVKEILSLDGGGVHYTPAI